MLAISKILSKNAATGKSTSEAETETERGLPDSISLPFMTVRVASPSIRLAICVFIFSAVSIPMRRPNKSAMRFIIIASTFLPPIFTFTPAITPSSDTAAMLVVPPPTSIIKHGVLSDTGMPNPRAVNMGDSTKSAL
ncbi:unknown [Acidiphilium sp. CAG:727]|nr:unknown [Acidiphilium sp. CAG:727]